MVGQPNNFDYRYMVYNTRKGEFQFMRICETTKQGAEKLLYNFIGKDSLNHKFNIRRVTREEAEKIKARNKLEGKTKKLKDLLPELSVYEIEEIIKENEKRGVERTKKYNNSNLYERKKVYGFGR